MAHIKQNVLGVMTGKVGTISTYSNRTGNVARIRTNATNVGEGASRTVKQQSNRVRWANLVNFYKASKNWMPKAFEAKKKTRSDYNQFMSINYGNARVALTKQLAAAGACVAEGYLISQGSLVPVQVQKHGDHYDTNIALGTLQLTANTTVAEFAAAVVASNNFVREGMQLSCVSYQQTVDDLGTPRIICTAYEMILDTNNTSEKAMSYLPEFCLASEDGLLVTSDNISVGAFAFVLSETISGRTLVSTQTLIVNNEVLLAEYTSDTAMAAAIESYVMNGLVFLDATTAESKGATPQPLYIEKLITFDGAEYVANDSGLEKFVIETLSENQSNKLIMSADINAVDVKALNVVGAGSIGFIGAQIKEVSGNEIIFGFTASSWDLTQKIQRVELNVADTWYELPFSVE